MTAVEQRFAVVNGIIRHVAAIKPARQRCVDAKKEPTVDYAGGDTVVPDAAAATTIAVMNNTLLIWNLHELWCEFQHGIGVEKQLGCFPILLSNNEMSNSSTAEESTVGCCIKSCESSAHYRPSN